MLPAIRTRRAVWCYRKIRDQLGLGPHDVFLQRQRPLHIDTAMTFLGIGIPIMQGYGFTETSPVVSVSRLTANEYGAVGRPIAGVDVRDRRGWRMLMRGRNVMQGYYREPRGDGGRDQDGWLHTGDVGGIDRADICASPIARGEIFKTGTGKWISPSRVEAAIKRSIFVTQAHGDRQRVARTQLAIDHPNWAMVRSNSPLPKDAANAAAGRPRDDVLVSCPRSAQARRATWRATSRFAESSSCRASSASRAASFRPR